MCLEPDEEFCRVIFQSGKKSLMDVPLPQQTERGAYEFHELNVTNTVLYSLTVCNTFNKTPER